MAPCLAPQVPVRKLSWLHIVYILWLSWYLVTLSVSSSLQSSPLRPVFLNAHQTSGRWSSLDNVVNTWGFRIYFVCVDLLVSKAGSCCILMLGFRIVSHSLGTIHRFQGAQCGGVFVTVGFCL